MKRNILTVVILALSVVNLILTAIIIFTVVPNSKKTNNLINQVTQIIDLEVEKDAQDKGITADDISIYEVSSEEDLYINLKSEPGVTKESYAKVTKVSLSLYKDAKDYSDVKKTMDGSTTIITDKVRSILSSYTKQEAKANEVTIKAEIVKELNEYFDTNTIVDISFGTLVYE